jgi:hypothetical protein
LASFAALLLSLFIGLLGSHPPPPRDLVVGRGEPCSLCVWEEDESVGALPSASVTPSPESRSLSSGMPFLVNAMNRFFTALSVLRPHNRRNGPQASFLLSVGLHAAGRGRINIMACRL